MRKLGQKQKEKNTKKKKTIYLLANNRFKMHKSLQKQNMK